jgi:hypothetical protein
MKLLEITQELEQAMVQIFDTALKAGGMALLVQIDKVRNAIKVTEEDN